MFIDKNSIKVNNVSLGQYITNVEYQYNKLWGEDSGRNLAGDQSGTFLGVYPKFVISFRKLTKAEMEIITPLIDSPYQIFKYYDPTKKANLIITTYTGDYSFVNKSIIGKHKNEPFQVSFIAVSRRN